MPLTPVPSQQDPSWKRCGVFEVLLPPKLFPMEGGPSGQLGGWIIFVRVWAKGMERVGFFVWLIRASQTPVE